MDRKARRRVNALRRLMEDRDSYYNHVPLRPLVVDPIYTGFYAWRYTNIERIEHEIATLRERIPSDVLVAEGLE